MKKEAKTNYILRLSGLLILIASVAVFSACNDMLNTDGTKGEGTMNFYLTNSNANVQKGAEFSNTADKHHKGPLNLQEVNLDVQEIRVRYSTVRIDTVNADSVVESEGDREWVTIPAEPVTVNLLDLANADTLIAEADLEEGYYSEIRLILGNDNNVVDEDGNVHDLKVPSGQQSGFKIKFDTQLYSGQTLDLTIEFDAEKSIHLTGNNRYMLQPVMKVRTEPNNDS